LKTLDKENKLHRITVDGYHLEMTTEWFIDNILEKFLRDSNPTKNGDQNADSDNKSTHKHIKNEL
jgi:hypothetical protein